MPIAAVIPHRCHRGAVYSAHQRPELMAADRAPRPLNGLDDRSRPLLTHPALDVAQPRLSRTGDIPLVPRDKLLAELRRRAVAEQQIHKNIRHGLRTAPTA